MREFEFDREFVAADGLVYGGKRYASGELFDRKTLGVSDGDLWDLWVMGRIDAIAQPYEPSDAELERMTAPARPTAKAAQPPRR